MNRFVAAVAVAVTVLATSTAGVDAKPRSASVRADQPTMFMRVAVLLINFTNQPSETFGKDDVERLYFTGVAFYRVMKNGRLLADVDAWARSYRDASAGSGTLRYSVTAFDAAGNASRPINKKVYR